MARRAGVAGRVRDRGGNRAGGQYASDGHDGIDAPRRNGHAPGTVRLYQRGVAVAVNHHGHRLTGWRRGGPADDQVRLCFSGVKDIVSGNGIDRNQWRRGIQSDGTTRIGRVTTDIGDANADLFAAVGQ